MKRYMDIDGDSNVLGYETDFIRVQFKNRSVYLYTDASAGNYNIEKMKSLAEAGDGLNSFIIRHVRRCMQEKRLKKNISLVLLESGNNRLIGGFYEIKRNINKKFSVFS